jgi:hypothetical protein
MPPEQMPLRRKLATWAKSLHTDKLTRHKRSLSWTAWQTERSAFCFAITVLVVCIEWSVAEWTQPAKPFLVPVLTSILLFLVKFSRKAFIAIGLAVSANRVGART